MGKSTATKRPVRRTAAKGVSNPPTRSMPPWAWIVVAAAVAAALLIWAPWQNDPAPESGADPAALTHVHGLGINPADGQLYVATHNGVFQLSADGGPAQLVGTGEQDTMGFTIAGSDQFLASGHPAPGQGGPSHLGLMESADGGLTWSTRSLAGEADFHALRFRHGIVYGFNSVTGQLMISSDRVDWQTRDVPPLRDFAVSPDDPDTLLATTQSGVQRSTDGGAAWTPAGGPPMLLLAWESADQLWGIATTGEVFGSPDGGVTWNTSGKMPGQTTAFATHDGVLYAAVHEAGVQRSDDGGATWTKLHD